MRIHEITKKGKEVLERIVKDYNLDGAVIISEEGLPLASFVRVQIDEDMISASGAALVSAAITTAKNVGKGKLNQVTLKTDKGYLLFTKMEEGTILGVMTSEKAKLGVILMGIREALKDLISS